MDDLRVAGEVPKLAVAAREKYRRLRAFEQDQNNFGTPVPIQSSETNLEFNYQAQIVPGWLMQPVLTYVWRPEGYAGKRATVTGLRSIWRY